MARIATLEAEIRRDVLRHGASVKGKRIYAVCKKGWVSWDAQDLGSYAATHPEIQAFRKEGEPSVSLRAVK